jgi:ferritin-like metal-binding protein YciE
MKFKELREADLSKAQIKKVHDKADDLPKNDFIKRYGKDGDSVRFATATKMVKKELGIGEGFKSDAQRKAAFASGYKEKGKKKEEVEEGGPGSGPQHKDITITRDGKTKTVKGAALSVWKKAGWVKEELDDKDKETIKPIIKQLQKSVKAHGKQAKQLQKDIKDEVSNEGGPGSGPQHGEITITKDGKSKKVKRPALSIFKKAGWKQESVELDEVHFSNRGEPPAPKGMHKLRSGRDIPSTPQVDKIHKKVVLMTDMNDHFGARIEIAKQVGDKQLVQVFSSLKLIHDKYSGAVGNQAIELRNKFSPVLNNAIDRKFGKYADVIRDGL